MKLNMSQWKKFLVSDIFDIYNGRGITQEEIEKHTGNFPAVQSGEDNNGILGYMDLAYAKSQVYCYTETACLTVARSGTAGCINFFSNGCIVGDSAKILKLKTEQSNYAYLFLQTLLEKLRYKYSYGRKVTENKYKAEVIWLPTDVNEDPDWQWMEDYVKSLRSEPIKTVNSSSPLDIDTTKWTWFKFGSLIDEIYKAEAHSKTDLYGVSNSPKDGYVPFVTRTEENNAVDCYVDAKEVKVEKGNAFVIGDTTSTVSYQPKPFSTGDHIVVIRASWLNEITGLFLVALLQRERFRYSYGRAFVMDSIKETSIKLPATSTGEPDWEWMESYMRSLPYGDRIG